LKRGGTVAAAGSIIFALVFNILLFVAAPLLLTNALFIAAGWAPSAAASAESTLDPQVEAMPIHATTSASPAKEQAWYAKTWTKIRS
jgi:hypothetical protein